MSQQRNPLTILWLIALLLISAPTRGQEDRNQDQPREAVKIEAVEVLVDVIVSDNKNRMITDLTPTAFEILENGVRQPIKSVRLIRQLERTSTGSEPQPTTRKARSPAGSTQVVSQGQGLPNLIAMVFDNQSLRPENRLYARRAAREYIDEMAPEDRLAVFGTDARLFMVQSFIDDKKSLKNAVDQATTGTSLKFASSAAAAEQLIQNSGVRPQALLTDVGMDPTRVVTTTAGQTASTSFADTTIDTIVLRMFRSFERYEHDVQARSTILSLLSIIRGMQLLPGRKAVVFFSEGFALPSSLWSEFRSVMDTANRANVAIYTIDAGGLRTESEGQKIGRELEAMGRQRDLGADPTIIRQGESMLGRSERLGRGNRESVLIDLALSTGGLAIRNSNDLASGLGRINQDLRSYYLISYEPTNQNFDGGFRHIEVKVNRPKVNVRAREGYFALRTTDGAPVFDFEQTLLGLAYAAAPPRDFDLGGVALRFPTSSRATQVPIIASIPVNAVKFSNAEAKKKKGQKKNDRRLRGDLGVLALVKDPRGTVVRKVSQRYKLSYSDKQLKALENKNFLFQRTIDVMPGKYQVDIVAQDLRSGQASVTRIALIVPDGPAQTLDISSIVPTKGSSAANKEEERDNPLYFDQGLVSPNLERTFSKAVDKNLMLYFAVQTKPGATVRAKVQFIQAGQLMAEAPGMLPPADQDGRIRFLATFPLVSFPLGTYGARVLVNDGKQEVRSNNTVFSIVN